MCGIVTAIATRNIVPVLLEGLRKLEYRGYDSAGLAVLHDGEMVRLRSAGRVAELMERPAERALVEGIRLYDNAQYPAAEAALQRALAAGLVSVRDQASAHKLIAFIACTSAREAECEAAFRAARAADPAFALSRAEAGHPMWGPVYRRVTGP